MRAVLELVEFVFFLVGVKQDLSRSEQMSV